MSDQASPAPRAGPRARFAHSPLAGFVPWILFSAIGGPNTWETAAIAALIAAVLLTLFDIGVVGGDARAESAPGTKRPKLLDVASIIFFGGFAIAAFTTDRGSVTGVDQYAQVIASGALALIAFGSVLFDRPFTVDYAKEETPPEVWDTPLFKQVNVVLTLIWGTIFGLCALLGVAAVNATSKGAHDWFTWYLPIILIVGGFKLNSWYPDAARKRAGLAE